MQSTSSMKKESTTENKMTNIKMKDIVNDIRKQTEFAGVY